MRKTKEELNAIKKKYNTNELWSWSKFHTYKTSHYEFLLKYIQHIPENRTDGAYTAYGGACHDILEKYYNKQIDFKDMTNEFEDVLITLDMADLKFSRGDNEKNDKIKSKYIENLKHFFKFHTPITAKMDTERFITINVNGNIFQGYIDAIRKDSDSNFIIQDWKSSSLYKGDKIDKEKGQLVLYAEGLHQLGIPYEKIKICWDFLKYCNVEVQSAKGIKSIRQIERTKIGESLTANAKMWLKKFGYDEDSITDYISDLNMLNTIEVLPPEVQDKYSISDCYVYIPLDETVVNDLLTDITNTINEINEKTSEYEKSKDDKLFWDYNIEKDDFYYGTLCGYIPATMKPYQEYLDKKAEKERNKDNVFGGVGSENDNDSGDMSWLNEL